MKGKRNFVCIVNHYIAILAFISLFVACERPNHISDSQSNGSITPGVGVEDNLNHVTFYLENSGSMFGYVNTPTTKPVNFVTTLANLSQMEKFIDDEVSMDFNFINGPNNLVVTPIGNSPTTLASKLNTNGFNVGNVTGSDLNAMFHLALNKAGGDSISILVTDAIFDIQQKQTPATALQTLIVESTETRSQFIQRLNRARDIQTLIIKLTSHFDGDFFFGVSPGKAKISQDRPYYIFVFGKSEFLNKYFGDEYLTNSLPGYDNHVRFYVPDSEAVDYRPTSHNIIGDFRFSPANPTTLTHVRSSNFMGNTFQFSVAVDFSNIPVTEDYLLSINNYLVDGSYKIENIEPINSNMALGAIGSLKPTHLITLSTIQVPTGVININLINRVPSWIEGSHTDNDTNIVGNTNETFGFKYLTSGIVEAYKHVSNTEYLTKMSITLKR